MRIVINFTVRGRTKADLQEKAVQLYRELKDDPDADLPFSATITISPDVADPSSTGGSANRGWIGEVSIAVPAEQEGK